MRSANLAAMGASLLLSGCANAWLPFPSPPAAALAHPVEPAPVECSAKASLPFGSGANTSSLSLLVEETANNHRAERACTWEKGTHVTHGSLSLSGPTDTGAIPERK